MNIILSNLSYFPEYGGVENSLSNIAKELTANGHKVTILAGKKTFRKIDKDDEEYEVRRFILRPFKNSVLNYIFLPLSLFHLVLQLVAIRRKGADYCLNRNQFISFFTTRLLPCKHIYLPPGFSLFQYADENVNSEIKGGFKKHISAMKRGVNSWLDYKALFDNQNIFVFSENMSLQATYIATKRKQSAPEISLCKPGVDINEFCPATKEERRALRKRLGLPKNKYIVLCVGRLVAAKGFELAIDSMLSLNEDIFLVIVGEGVEKEHLLKICNEKGLNRRILFAGSSSSTQSYYRCSDLFLMTSKYEPLGQTVLEASAAGLPVISLLNNKLYRHSDYIVTNATYELLGDLAFYVKQNDTASLSEAINDFYNFSREKHEEIACKARSFVKIKYTWKNLCEDLFE